jgi:hypothetical protein
MLLGSAAVVRLVGALHAVLLGSGLDGDEPRGVTVWVSHHRGHRRVAQRPKATGRTGLVATIEPRSVACGHPASLALSHAPHRRPQSVDKRVDGACERARRTR